MNKTPAPDTLSHEKSLHQLWISCAEEGAFEDGKTNVIECYVSPHDFCEIMDNTMRMSREQMWEMGGGFGIKFFIRNQDKYSVKGFSHYEM